MCEDKPPKPLFDIYAETVEASNVRQLLARHTFVHNLNIVSCGIGKNDRNEWCVYVYTEKKEPNPLKKLDGVELIWKIVGKIKAS